MTEEMTLVRAGRAKTEDGWIAFLIRVSPEQADLETFPVVPENLIIVVGPFEIESEAEQACSMLHACAGKTAERLGGYMVPDKKEQH